MGPNENIQPGFVVCIDAHGHDLDLRLHKIYRVIPDTDPRVKEDGLIRIIDESGEDYLYDAARFVPLEVPGPIKESLLKSAGVQEHA